MGGSDERGREEGRGEREEGSDRGERGEAERGERKKEKGVKERDHLRLLLPLHLAHLPRSVAGLEVAKHPVHREETGGVAEAGEGNNSVGCG